MKFKTQPVSSFALISSFASHIQGPVRTIITGRCVSPSSLAVCVSHVITGRVCGHRSSLAVCMSRVITAVCVSRGQLAILVFWCSVGRAHKKAACHSTPAHRFVVGFVHFV